MCFASCFIFLSYCILYTLCFFFMLQQLLINLIFWKKKIKLLFILNNIAIIHLTFGFTRYASALYTSPSIYSATQPLFKFNATHVHSHKNDKDFKTSGKCVYNMRSPEFHVNSRANLGTTACGADIMARQW